jgi:hypothetical protein
MLWCYCEFLQIDLALKLIYGIQGILHIILSKFQKGIIKIENTLGV